MVESRYNLIELAPKGTGKSFVFENLSRYVAVRSGAISAPVLFFNDARKTPGLITRYDCVVIDEAQKVRGDSSGELTALLKSYLESGRFGRGSAGSITSESGLVMLANIELDEHRRPSNESIGLMRAFPNFLRETAFIDRFSGLLPGWDLPRVTKDTPSSAVALKGDIFGEILHMIRNDISYRDFVKTNMELNNCDDMRDSRAVEAGVSGFLKILFPNKQPSEQDFYKYCVNPAIELRQRVRDELCKLDREYAPVTFNSKLPDAFQRNHRPARYIDPESLEQLLQSKSSAHSEPLLAVDQEEAELLAFFGEADQALIEAVQDKKLSAQQPEEPKLTEEERLIRSGENAKLEFKSSLRWNIKANRNDTGIEHSVLKTIVAFLNTEGGTLLVGVDDNRNVLGIAVDQFANDDKFLLHFANLVSDKIGKHYAAQIRWELKELGGKKILRVDCKPSSGPVFLKMHGKEEFFIRNGPSSILLSTSEVLEYSKNHFGQSSI